MFRTEDINWELIVESINQLKTVLFIGPELTINYGKPSEESGFLKAFAQQHPNDVLSFHEEDEFLIFKDETTKLNYLYKIRDFYQKDFTNPLLEKLSEIPFHLIISITPDLSLNRIFEARKFAYEPAYYKTKITQEIGSQPSANKPLIYNLLGCVEDPESLIISHYDLFGLIQSIYADRNLPQEITSAFNRDVTQNIIFLGFDFNKWYFQLILHLLKINFDPCVRYAASQDLKGKHLQTLCESHFKILFISNDPVHFVNTLHSKFPSGQLRQSLPKPQTRQKPKKENIKWFLEKAFDSGHFGTFCMINFEEVYDNFTPEQSQVSRIIALMDYVRKHEEWDKLLSEGKKYNPVQYKNFEPYYEEF